MRTLRIFLRISKWQSFTKCLDHLNMEYYWIIVLYLNVIWNFNGIVWLLNFYKEIYRCNRRIELIYVILLIHLEKHTFIRSQFLFLIHQWNSQRIRYTAVIYKMSFGDFVQIFYFHRTSYSSIEHFECRNFYEIDSFYSNGLVIIFFLRDMIISLKCLKMFSHNDF